jgi:serine protease Do
MKVRQRRASFRASGRIVTAIAAFVIAAAPSLRADEVNSGSAAILRKVVPAVVSITVHKQVPSASAATDAATAQSPPDAQNVPPDIKPFVASGFVIDPAGVIVTNYHVVENALQIMVAFSDGTVLSGNTLSADYFADIALIKVNSAQPLAVANWGDSQKLELGDQVFAAGNPFGLGLSLSAGIISALDRNIHNSPYDDYIQTDAAINHGNSGGPLINTNGDVVGVDSDLISPTTGSVGLGFALPSNTARFVIDRLRQYGWVHPSWIGVKVQQLTFEMAEAMGQQQARGSIVAFTWPASPAAKAGLEIGDLIETLDGEQPRDERALLRHIAQAPAGKTLAMTILRGTQTHDVAVTVEPWPRVDWDKRDTPLSVTEPKLSVPPDLGLSLEAVAESERKAIGLAADQTGVMITQVLPGTEAARRGIVKGDVIERVQDVPVATPADVLSALNSARSANRRYVMMLMLPTVRVNPGPEWLVLPLEPLAN